MTVSQGVGHRTEQGDWVENYFGPGFVGHAAELGALDGITLSNTLQLEGKGWEVLCIEPNPRWHAALKANRRLVSFSACDIDEGEADLWEHPKEVGFTRTSITWTEAARQTREHIGLTSAGRVQTKTLDTCLEEAGFPKLDVLALDVDGMELKILMGADLVKWHPTAIIVEICYGQDPAEFLNHLGYTEQTVIDWDHIFVRG